MPISLGYATADPDAVVTAIALGAVLEGKAFEVEDARGFPTIRLPGWTPDVPLALEGTIEVDGQALFRDCCLAPEDDVDCVLVARSFAKPGYRWVIDSFPIRNEDARHTVEQDLGQGLVGGGRRRVAAGGVDSQNGVCRRLVRRADDPTEADQAEETPGAEGVGGTVTITVADQLAERLRDELDALPVRGDGAARENAGDLTAAGERNVDDEVMSRHAGDFE